MLPKTLSGDADNYLFICSSISIKVSRQNGCSNSSSDVQLDTSKDKGEDEDKSEGEGEG